MWKCNVLLGVSGSISAFKVCEAVSQLTQMGHRVRIAATESSLKFVGASTWEGLTGEPPLLSSFENRRHMAHIQWQREADLIVFAPATAHTLNAMAAGLGGSPLLDLYLAHDFKKPFLVVPAMNSAMWNHPATQNSYRTLSRQGLIFIGPDSGSLACGELGAGRLIAPQSLMSHLLHHLPKPTHSRSFLITYGGTEEPIDDVRTLSNRSTGQSGSQLAAELTQRGHKVEVLRSERSPEAPYVLNQKTFMGSDSLQRLLELRLKTPVDTWVQMAAVSDFKVAKIQNGTESLAERPGKLSSDEPELTLKLKRAPKLIQELGSKRPKSCKLVAFKLTSHASVTEARQAVLKLVGNSPVDFVLHNDLKDHLKGAPVYTLFSGQGEALGTYRGGAELAILLSEGLPSTPQGLQEKEAPHDLVP